MNPVVIITDVTDLDPGRAIEVLEAAGYSVHVLDLVSDPVVPEAARAAVAAIVGFAQVNGAVLEQLPDLRVLATMSAGLDMIDEARAAERGIEVIPLVDVSTREVATHALMLILAAVRGLPESTGVVASGGWTAEAPFVPRACEEITLGLLGFGRIARALAEQASGLFAEVIAHDPYADIAGGARQVSMDELLRTSGVLSLHVPMTPETRAVINAEAISKMPYASILVNVSRGDLVDERAVCSALDDGALAAYAADVLAGEPPVADHPLRRHRRAIVTPHVAYRSNRSVERYTVDPVESIIRRLGNLSTATNKEFIA